MRTVDLFSGCGGMSLGFENAGFEIVGAFELWGIAARCYSSNFNHPVYTTDLSQTEKAIEDIKKLKPELIIGGPPCQDFSHAGKRIESDRASLTGSFAEIVSSLRPRCFVMENVGRALNSNAYFFARQVFKDAGYGLTEVVLDASFCGVPQKRKRFFCIGMLEQQDGFALEHINKNLSTRETTLRDYFGNTLDFEYYYRHPRNYNRRAVFSIDEPAPTMRGVNRPVPKGYPGHPNDACQLNNNIRALTTLERALIQVFPADFKWVGTKTEMEQMIGNAVPVKLAEFVAKTLQNCIKQATEELVLDKDGFKLWLQETHTYSERSLSDIFCRLKRADSILKMKGEPSVYYIFELEQISTFSSLSINVRSQIKKSILLYAEYCRALTSRWNTIENREAEIFYRRSS